MISDEPNEDADDLDDGMLLADFLDGESPRRESRTDPAPNLPDWPPRTVRDVGLNLDNGILAWFKATHADWRREVGLVLRAWAGAQSQAVREAWPRGRRHESWTEQNVIAASAAPSS